MAESGRLLLALEAGRFNEVLLEMAAILAADLNLELSGILIEDSDMMRAADLPFTREIMLSSARERDISSAQLMRILHSCATEIHRALAQAATQSRVKWTLETVRCKSPGAILKEHQPAEIIMLRGQHHKQDRLSPSISRSTRCAYLFHDGSDTARRAYQTAIRLARRNALDLVLITLPECQETDTSLRHLPHQDPHLAEKLHLKIVHCHQKADARSLMQMVNPQDSYALIMPGSLPLLATPGQLDLLISHANCPILIVQ